jgi:aspartyl-tRNA synthetase
MPQDFYILCDFSFFMLRTHTCGDLRKENIGSKVTVAGWVSTRRDHGGLIFIDLRDRYGLTQVVFEPTHNDKVFTEAETLRREFVIQATGIVRRRPEGMINPKLDTGEIEVLADEIETLNIADTPPIEIDDRKIASEDMRLKYRYLDLRRAEMQKKLLIRHKAAQAAREFLSSQSFLEIETPLLVRHTPEGARDYVVPSRVNPGKAYSLPQSPQLYKQILMVSGCDRYFQLARCLRDEDLRADRQPEFTQIDLEMSFVDEKDVQTVTEGLMKNIFQKSIGVTLDIPFKRITYDDSMSRYGCDKPDLRFGLELTDVTEIVKNSDFSVFKDVIKHGGIVKCINPEQDFSRNELDDLIEQAKKFGAKGMVWARVSGDVLESSIAKYLSPHIQKEMIHAAKAKKGVLLFVADTKKNTNAVLSAMRNELGKRLKLIDESSFNFCWVVDFDMFEWNDDEDRWEAAHHMFTMPKKELLPLLEKEPGKVKASLYDLVLNGIEMGSGSVRIHRPDIQEMVMNVVGLDKKKAEKKFGFLLEAFKYGAPPHAGIGLGFDRICSMMTGTNDIREVIAFPKNKAAECPMDGCPSELDEKVAKEVHIKFDLPKKKK